ncbi:hypothetical protein TUMEXPCC7403_02685 [Tumidithrix helvetica PCC 7403]
MSDRRKTKAQLLKELEALRAEVASLKGERSQQASWFGSRPQNISYPQNESDSHEIRTPYTILILDDSESDRLIYRRFLPKLENGQDRFQIVEFDNGEDALTWCNQQMPDIFLIDYFLLDMTGLEFLWQLRQQTDLERIPAIVLTGQGNTEIAVELLKSGAADYLDKSQITSQSLQKAITHVLKQTKLMQQLKWHQGQQQLISKTTLSIRQSLKLEDILNATVTEVRDLLQCDRVLIYQFTQTQNIGTGFVTKEAVSDPAFSILDRTIQDDCFGEFWVETYSQGRTRAIEDIYTEPDLSNCYIEFLEQFQVQSILTVPILQEENLWGLLIAHHCAAPRPWVSLEVELMNQLATQVGIAIQQATLVEQLQTAKADLEVKVQVRTSGLEESNQQLSQEILERQQAESSLRESEDRIRAILEGIPDIINLIDAEGIYLGAIRANNDRDLVPKNINPIGMNIADLLPADIAIAQIRAIQRALETHQIQMLEQKVSLGSRVQHEEVRVVPIRDDAALVIIRDISDRKYAEEALQKKQSFFEKVLSVNPNEIYVYDLIEQCNVYANKTFSETWGYTPEELQRMGTEMFRCLIHPDDHSLLEQHHQQCLTLQDNERIELEYRFRHANGEWHWVQSRDTPFCRTSDGGVQQILGTAQDITKRKRAEIALRDSQRLIEKITTTTPNLLYIYDHLEQRNVYMNRSVTEMLGYSTEDVQRMGANLFPTICHPDDLMRVYQAIAQCSTLQDGEFIEIEYRVRNARGEWCWLHSRDTVFSRDSEGRVKQTLGTSEDITDRKQREEMLENISLGVSAQTGEMFFRASVQYLTKALNVEFAFVSEIVDLKNDWVKTVAAYGDGQFLDEFNYKLDGTPCETVLNKHLCVYPAKLQEIFPRDRILTVMGVESYAGTTLISSTGEPLGLISIMSRNAITNSRLMEEVLKIFAARASSELERQQSDAKLKLQYQQAQLFAEVTLKIRQSLQLDEILQTAVSEVQQILQADRVLIYQVFPDGTGKAISEAVLPDFPKVLGIKFPEEVFPTEYQQLYAQGRVRAIANLNDPTSGITECLVEFSRGLDVKAKLIVPILASNQTTLDSTGQNSLWGLLIAHQCIAPRQWNDSETELLGQLASQLGIAIAQSQLIENLQNSEEKYRHLIDNLHAGVVVHAPDTSVILCNSNACQLLGLTVDQIFGKTAIDPAWQFFREDGTLMPLEEYPVNQVLSTGLPLVNYVSRINRSDRTQVWVLVNAFPEFDLNHQIKQIAISFIDISDLKQVEEKLRKSESALAEAQRIAHIGNWHFELATGKVTWSREMFRIFGLDPEQPAPTLAELHELIHPDDRAHQQQILAEGIASKQPYEFESRIIHADGSVRYTLAQGEPIFNTQGELIHLFGTSQDISDRKKAELETREVQNFLNSIIENIPNMLFVKDAENLQFVRFNKAGEELLGYSREALIGKSDRDFFSPEEADFFITTDREVLSNSQIIDIPEEFIQTREQGLRILHTKKIPLYDELGHPKYLLGISEDITERKQTENALQRLNQELEQRVEERTELLQQSEERFRGFFSHAPIGIAVTNIETLQFAAVNTAFCRLLGYSESEMLALPCTSVSISGGLEVEYPLTDALQRGEIDSYQLEKHFIKKNGETILGYITTTALRDTTGKVTHVMDMVQDITARKSAELQLRASLQEKEVMLKEIHHRVKNNLQMISSLLSLQASYIDDRQTLALFAESQSRIKVMALIHEKLYRSDNLAKINLCEYLTDLVGDLLQSYRAHSAVIDYRVEVEAVDLGIELAIPCGLIVNELFSNAIKHAFPNRPTGEIWIQFSKSDRIRETDYYLLSVGNNGVNFPQEIDFRNTESLGLQLVCGLTQQLRGKIELKNGEGCRFEILFPHLTQGLAT